MNPSSLVEVLAAVHPVHEVEVAHLVFARRPHPHRVVLIVLHGAPGRESNMGVSIKEVGYTEGNRPLLAL